MKGVSKEQHDVIEKKMMEEVETKGTAAKAATEFSKMLVPCAASGSEFLKIVKIQKIHISTAAPPAHFLHIQWPL